MYSLNREDKLEIKTIDNIMYRYFMIYKNQNNIKLEIASLQEQHNALIDSIMKISEKYKDVGILNPKNLNFIREEIMWIKACNYTEIETYQTVDRLGRTSQIMVTHLKNLGKNSKVREAIFETMIMYNDYLRKKNLIDFQDMGLIALSQASKKTDKKYTHVIIDETQDLTRVQLEFVKKLYREKPYSSFLFVADTAQSIYPQSWLIRGRSFASIGFDMKVNQILYQKIIELLHK